LANFHEGIADKYLNGEPITSDAVKRALREVVSSHSKEISLCFIGSALKNRGVQSLLNGVLQYLPSPVDRVENQVLSSGKTPINLKNELMDKKLIALVFKVINDPSYGQLHYTRVYSGSLLAKQEFRNSSTKATEKAAHLMRVQADDYKSVERISFGDIVALTGLKSTRSGDTLLSYGDERDLVLDRPDIPPPVFLCS
jgi:elongation factor G